MSYGSVIGHQSMVFDEHRNNFYAQAMRQFITPETVVLDLGAGLGIHGLMAAKMGARRVYMVEPTEVIRVAEMLVAENGLKDRVGCIQGLIEEVELPEKVDLIISVFTGNFLLEEDLLPSLFYARDRYLKPKGHLIPDIGRMEVVPVTLAECFDKKIVGWTVQNQGIDFSLIRKYAANTLFYEDFSGSGYQMLSAPRCIFELGFSSAQSADCHSQVEFEITQEGDCHGFLGWFSARTGKEWMSTAPDAAKMHWRQVYLPLDPPLELKCGDRLHFNLQRPEHGRWSWTVQYVQELQRHSTFLSQPFTPLDLSKKSINHKALLNDKGRVAKQVLRLLDGTHSTDEISGQIRQQYPQLFGTPQLAQSFVQRLISGFT